MSTTSSSSSDDDDGKSSSPIRSPLISKSPKNVKESKNEKDDANSSSEDDESETTPVAVHTPRAILPATHTQSSKSTTDKKQDAVQSDNQHSESAAKRKQPGTSVDKPKQKRIKRVDSSLVRQKFETRMALGIFRQSFVVQGQTTTCEKCGAHMSRQRVEKISGEDTVFQCICCEEECVAMIHAQWIVDGILSELTYERM